MCNASMVRHGGEEGSVQLEHGVPLGTLYTNHTEPLVYSKPVSLHSSLLASISVQCNCPLRFKIAPICYAQVVWGCTECTNDPQHLWHQGFNSSV